MWRIALIVLALLDAGCKAVAAERLEDPKNILAVQLRDQGYAINRRVQSGMLAPQNPTKRLGAFL